MIERRDLLKLGAASAALAAAPALATAAPAGVDALLVDIGYGPAPATAAQLLTFTGDVTQVWFETLDPRWRRPGFVLGGITGGDTLFLLERLAWDRGRRVVAMRALAAPGFARQPVSWIIAPAHPSVTA